MHQPDLLTALARHESKNVACAIFAMASLALLVLFLCVAAPAAIQGTPQRSDDTINVFLVPHSHDDVGWTETVYQYYTGTMYMCKRGRRCWVSCFVTVPFAFVCCPSTQAK